MIARHNMLGTALATAIVGSLVASALPRAQAEFAPDSPSASPDQTASRGARTTTGYVNESTAIAAAGSPSGRGPGRGARSPMPRPEQVVELSSDDEPAFFIRGARASMLP